MLSIEGNPNEPSSLQFKSIPPIAAGGTIEEIRVQAFNDSKTLIEDISLNNMTLYIDKNSFPCESFDSRTKEFVFSLLSAPKKSGNYLIQCKFETASKSLIQEISLQVLPSKKTRFDVVL